ncbi:hypothetical protein V6N11_056762 [Hibiscus sabdariffa]|uniref:Uncharacterized protein n=1 Tax=Hibiscus sabdariffa TaxID=183260 RepID=A0ABR2T4T8_9ROSI
MVPKGGRRGKEKNLTNLPRRRDFAIREFQAIGSVEAQKAIVTMLRQCLTVVLCRPVSPIKTARSSLSPVDASEENGLDVEDDVWSVAVARLELGNDKPIWGYVGQETKQSVPSYPAYEPPASMYDVDYTAM